MKYLCPTPSIVAFGPLGNGPSPDVLNDLRSWLQSNSADLQWVRNIQNLPQIWERYLAQTPELSTLDGQSQVQSFLDWVNGGHNELQTDNVGENTCMSGLIATPLLVILQLIQYYRFLNVYQLSHEEFLLGLCDGQDSLGSVQGYCTGFTVAAAVASSRTDEELNINATAAIYLAVGVGAYSDLMNQKHDTSKRANLLAVVLAHSNQERELLSDVQQVYIATRSDPLRVTFVGPAADIQKLQQVAQSRGLPATILAVRGRWHSVDNIEIAEEFYTLSQKHKDMQYKGSSNALRARLRSNADGTLLANDVSLTKEAIFSIMAKQCNWGLVVEEAIHDLKLRSTDARHHVIAIFGMSDCVSRDSIQGKGLDISKQEISKLLLRRAEVVPSHKAPAQSSLIAAIGLACRFPGADNVDEFWDVISGGKSQCRMVPKERIDFSKTDRLPSNSSTDIQSRFYGNFLSQIDEFDNQFFKVAPKEAIAMDPQQRILLETAYQAVQSAGLGNPKDIYGKNVGVFIGIGNGDYMEHNCTNTATAFSLTGTLRAFLCGKISHYFGWTGPSETIDTACSSSGVAINRACRALASGECDYALVGGANTISSPATYVDLYAAGFLSPTGPCKPFSSDADGYCRGEGVGLIFLQRMHDAVRDGHDVHAVLPGYGVNQSGREGAITAPNAKSQEALFRKVLDDSFVDVNRIQYVEAHGTGTQLGDKVECTSIKQVFRARNSDQTLYLGSVKANIGHTEPASGSASLIKAILMIQHGEIPPHINFSKLNEKLGLDMARFGVTTSKRPLPQGASILVNNYGAAGSNAAFIVSSPENYLPKKPPVKLPMHRVFHPVILSAHSQTALKAQMAALYKYISTAQQEISLESVAYTLSKRLVRHKYSWTASIDSISMLCNDLSSSAFSSASRIVETSGTQLQKLILVFGGQSSKYVGLVRDIYEHLPQLRHHLNICDSIVSELLGQSIYPAIFETKPVGQIAVLQCALFSTQYSWAMMWIESGAQVDGLVGHSFGEIAAFCVSGALSLRDAFKFIIGRASLLESIPDESRGGMLSVQGTKGEYEDCRGKLSENLRGQIEVACYNAPNQFVISGNLEAITAFEKSTHMKCKRLNVTHGFHSPVLDPIVPELANLVKSLRLQPARIPLEICTAEATSSPTLFDLGNNTRNPVYFEHAIRRIESRLGNSCIWMEMGLYSGTNTLVQKSCQQSEQHTFISGMDKKHALTPSLADQVTQLWASGHEISWWSSYSQDEERGGGGGGGGAGGAHLKELQLPPYVFDHSRHWLPLNLELSSRPGNKNTEEKRKPSLVSLQSQENNVSKFVVDLSSVTFQSMLHGHVVVQNPLTPASMYLECIAGGLDILYRSGTQEDLSQFGIEFNDVEIVSPLGSGATGQVSFDLNRTSSKQCWDISFHSVPNNHTKSLTNHMNGSVKLNKGGLNSEFDAYARLCKLRMEEMRRGGTEVLHQKKAYQLFSRVVNYSKQLRGISTLYTSDGEACADISLAASPESTILNPAAIDNFLQVAGLLINTHPSCEDESVFLATQLSKVGLIAREGPNTTWRVYSTISTLTANKASCDVFVFDATTGVLTAYILNAQFTKLGLASLTRLLSGTSQSNSGKNHIVQNGILTPASDEGNTTIDINPQPSSGGVPVKLVSINELAKVFETYAAGELPQVARDTTIESFGVDSLSAIELCRDIADSTNVEVEMTEFNNHDTLGSLLDSINATLQATMPIDASPAQSSAIKPDRTHQIDLNSGLSNGFHDDASATAAPPTPHEGFKINPVTVINGYQSRYSQYGRLHKFDTYCELVQQPQTEATIALILESLVRLGIDLGGLAAFEKITQPQILPKHDKLMRQLWIYLEDYGLVTHNDSQIYRSAKPIPYFEPAKLLLDKLISAFPQHAEEHKLLSITGLKLAECLSGKADPIKLLFHDEIAVNLMTAVYRNAPMFAAMTSMLLDVIEELFTSLSSNSDDTIHILEIGGGLGGTTADVLERLVASGRKVQYTFTDISPTFVAKARKRFANYDFLTFKVLDIEKEITDPSLKGKFDLVLGTNVIHATRVLNTSVSHIRSLLNHKGSVILSEIIYGPAWLDLVWGLLEGWWHFEDGRSYALIPVEEWGKIFKNAGFRGFSGSGGITKESQMQQLLVGSVQPSVEGLKPLSTQAAVVETLSYKLVDGLDLMADVYWPKQTTPGVKKPIALLIHGGGHMVLSKKAIRPNQCKYLVDQGFVAVAINYRLCPETSVIEVMQDVLDSLQWTRSTLPSLASQRGIAVDTSSIVAIGWSSGGHLAMSLGWTTAQAKVPPPAGILAFYSPSDYESGHWWQPIDHSTSSLEPTMSMEEIIASLAPGKQLQEYHVAAKHMEHAEEGWVSLSDARSELVLRSTQDGITIPILLQGRSFFNGSNKMPQMPSKEQMAAISPLHHVRTGTYQVPTYIIHGTGDKLVPVEMSVALHDALKQQGIETGLTLVPETSHTFDMFLRPGDKRWNEYVKPGMDFIQQAVSKP